MIAIYARQSVERADSISIEQQIELCRYETRGEPFREYTDRGFSGKNINRPQLLRMMDDIRSGFIHTVIVYRLDRISRSVLDFSGMMKEFGRYGVQFISATEKFDTSSPMGNAMLNICIVFAQLERETIQKRVADSYISRSRKSLYMGGSVPFGFRKIPTVIDGIRTSMYEAVPEEADTVRLIYELYSRPDTSYGDVVSHLVSLGITKRGKRWERARIRELVINPVYVRADADVYSFFTDNGAEVVNQPEDFIGVNGCYSYSGSSDKRKCSTSVAGEQIVIAPHNGIIDSSLWLECRRKCMAVKQVIPTQKAKNSWLCGKVKCAKCGYALTVKSFRARPQRYLLCSHRLNSKACEGAGTLFADEAEQLVSAEIRRKLGELRKLSSGRADVRLPSWDELSFSDKRRITDALIRAVYAADSRITIQWRF